jgi:hypothetical protein
LLIRQENACCIFSTDDASYQDKLETHTSEFFAETGSFVVQQKGTRHPEQTNPTLFVG